MSVDNSELLMLLGGKKSKSTIGKAGQQGFGVGVYGGSSSDLKAMGLTPMEGCDDPNSENYGNYLHTNGSVMAFIPAFAIRIGNASAPLYSKYGADTIEIGDVELAGKDGWAILRGFYDGGKLHSGFFIDKYLCSKDSTGTLAVSIKNKDPISLWEHDEPSSTMPNCSGAQYDAITLSRARGEHYALVSCYQWAIISLVSFAHAQAATSEKACAWYDASGQTNYPKGNNANVSTAYKDVDDKSILFTNITYSGEYSKTGSAVPLEKTTHNGQLSGICDVNGNKWQVVLGCKHPSINNFKAAKLYVKMHDFTPNGHEDNSLFDDYTVTGYTNNEWNYWESPALYATDDPKFPLCGVIPKKVTTELPVTADFGTDIFNVYTRNINSCLCVAGYSHQGKGAGVWCRRGHIWFSGDNSNSFRAAAYPP